MDESSHSILYITIYFLFYAFIASLLSLWIFVLLCRCYRLRAAVAPPPSPPPPIGGLDASAIETLPTFSFVGGAEGLATTSKGRTECVVCLGAFEDNETLRLMPGCEHVFHSGCVDVWLRSHATCPYCRTPVVAPPPAGDSPPEVRIVVAAAAS